MFWFECFPNWLGNMILYCLKYTFTVGDNGDCIFEPGGTKYCIVKKASDNVLFTESFTALCHSIVSELFGHKWTHSEFK